MPAEHLKEQRRVRLAAMPFHEKVRAVVQMQKRSAPLLRARGRHVRIWELEALEKTGVKRESHILDLRLSRPNSRLEGQGSVEMHEDRW